MRTTDDVAFEAFVTAHVDALLRLAVLLTGNRHSAEDLVQTALLEVQRRWSRIRAEDPYPYARRVLVTKVASWRRLRTTQEVVDLPAREPAGPDSTEAELDVGTRAATALGLPVLQDPRGLRAVVPQEWIDETVAQLVARPGLGVDGLRVTLLHAGGVRDTVQRSSVLVVGVAPSGASATVLGEFSSTWPVTATDAERGSGWGAMTTVTATREDRVPPTGRVLAVPSGDALTISAPVDTGTAEVLDARGDVLAGLPLQRGGVSAVVPGGASSVRVLDADGALVAEQPLTEVLD